MRRAAPRPTCLYRARDGRGARSLAQLAVGVNDKNSDNTMRKSRVSLVSSALLKLVGFPDKNRSGPKAQRAALPVSAEDEGV